MDVLNFGFKGETYNPIRNESLKDSMTQRYNIHSFSRDVKVSNILDKTGRKYTLESYCRLSTPNIGTASAVTLRALI